MYGLSLTVFPSISLSLSTPLPPPWHSPAPPLLCSCSLAVFHLLSESTTSDLAVASRGSDALHSRMVLASSAGCVSAFQQPKKLALTGEDLRQTFFTDSDVPTVELRLQESNKTKCKTENYISFVCTPVSEISAQTDIK